MMFLKSVLPVTPNFYHQVHLSTLPEHRNEALDGMVVHPSRTDTRNAVIHAIEMMESPIDHDLDAGDVFVKYAIETELDHVLALTARKGFGEGIYGEVYGLVFTPDHFIQGIADGVYDSLGGVR